MKKLIYILIIFTMTMQFNACTERIEIELEEGFTRLVVEGEITTDTMRHAVRLSKSGSYFHNEQPPAVSGAAITISDGTEVFPLTEISPGFYLTDRMAGEAGKTYSLNIDLAEEINGYSNYSASSEIMLVYPVDSIGLLYIAQWEAWIVNLFAYEPPSNDFYMFNVMVNGQLVSDSIDEVNVSDDRLFNGSYSNGIGVAFLDEDKPDEVLSPGDKVTLILSTVTEDYANFVWELQAETGYNNPLFGGPPANIRSNISNGALGYFAAYGKVYASTIAGKKK